MDGQPRFDVEVAQNRDLSPHDAEVHAAVTVTADGEVRAVAAPAAQVVVVDTSGSMGYGRRIEAARRATAAAVDALRDDALFAVVEGNDDAALVYPASGGLVPANPVHRRAAKRAVAKLTAGGRTETGKWLDLARTLLAPHPAAVRHVILLTDGRNTQAAADLDAALARCARVFTCDVLGIGTDWEPAEVIRVAAALNGAVDAADGQADLVAHFAAITRKVMARLVPEVRLRVRPSQWAEVVFLKQTHPVEIDLAREADGPSVLFGTGSWGAETRQFHLVLSVQRRDAPLERELRAARVDVEVRPAGSTGFARTGSPASVLVCWTDDLLRSSEVHPLVARFAGQGDLAKAVNEGCAAYAAGDAGAAETAWGEAVALAHRVGNTKVMARLTRLVHVEGDPAEGRVRVRDDIAAGDMLSLIVGSTHSGIVDVSQLKDQSSRTAAPPAQERKKAAAAAAPDRPCPSCAEQNPATSLFCGACGTHL